MSSLPTRMHSISTLTGHEDSVYALCFHPDGSKLVSSSRDGTAIIWDVRQGSVAHRLRPRAGPLTSLAISPDGNLLATGSAKRVVLWRVQGCQRRGSLRQGGAECVAFSPDGRTLLVGTAEGDLSVWDLESARLVDTIGLSERAILSLQFAPDLAAVAAACGDGVVVWLETDGWSPSHSIRLTPGEESIVYRWVIAPDGQTCAGSLHIPRDGLRDRYE